MEKVIEKILKFRDERDWSKFHTPENLAKSISIEANELLENYQWGNENTNIENVKDELADVITYCILLADSINVEINEIIMNKIEKNEKKYPVEKVKGSSKKYTEYT